MVIDARNAYCGAPALAAVGRTKSVDAAALERHNDGAVGLNHRLTSEPARVIGRGYARTPGQAAIVGRAHQNVAAPIRLIPFRIAVSVVRTLREVVAGGPVLIVQFSVVDDDRLSPMDAVRRTTHGYISDRARVFLILERER